MDSSKELHYDEFVDALFRAQTQDTRMYLMFMQLRLQKIEYGLDDRISKQFDEMKQHVSSAVSQLGGGLGGMAPPQVRLDGSGLGEAAHAGEVCEEEGVQPLPPTNRPYMASQGVSVKCLVQDAAHSAAPPPPPWQEAASVDVAHDARTALPFSVGVGSALRDELRAMRLSLERRLDAIADEIVASVSRLGTQQNALAEALCHATEHHHMAHDEALPTSAVSPRVPGAAAEATDAVGALSKRVGGVASEGGRARQHRSGADGDSADALMGSRISGDTRWCNV